MQQPELEEALREAQADDLAGKTTIQAQGGDSRINSEVHRTPRQRIQDIVKALSLIDPEQYPPSCVTRVSETKVSFTSQLLP